MNAQIAGSDDEAAPDSRHQFLVADDLARVLDQDSHIDVAVRRRIASLSRRVPEGSAEYDVLYRQYYEQERRKQGR